MQPIRVIYKCNDSQGFEQECASLAAQGYVLHSSSSSCNGECSDENWQAIFVLPAAMAKVENLNSAQHSSGKMPFLIGNYMAVERGDEKKLDRGKPMWDLLPLSQVSHIVDVLTFGAQKYGPHQWQTVDNATERYFASLMRHLEAWRSGRTFDKESSLRHLGHVGCCLLFLMWLEDERLNTKEQNGHIAQQAQPAIQTDG